MTLFLFIFGSDINTLVAICQNSPYDMCANKDETMDRIRSGTRESGVAIRHGTTSDTDQLYEYMVHSAERGARMIHFHPVELR